MEFGQADRLCELADDDEASIEASVGATVALA